MSDPVLPSGPLHTCSGAGEAVYHSCASEGFRGGFYLSKRIPRVTGDFLFQDQGADTHVLMWGIIYNRDELISRYGLAGDIPDPELAGRLFIRMGPDFVRQLNGDFAIIIRQPAAGRVLLFRDHVGIRPLAWAERRGVFFFSSDVTGLYEVLKGKERMNSEYLMPFFRYIDLRLTPGSGIRKVLPGYYVEFTAGGIRSTRYWNPGEKAVDQGLTHARLLEELGTISRDAIRIRCDSRYRSAAHVSGGLDSCFVAAHARRACKEQQDFPGYSWSPERFDQSTETRNDERLLVKAFCDQAGIRPVFSRMSPGDYRRFIGSMSDNHGVFAERHTLEQAVADGVNLIFSGWGGDEFISTGAAAIEADLLFRMKIRLFFRRNPVFPLKRFVKRVLYCIVFPALHIHERPVAEAFRDDAMYLMKPFRKSDRKAVSRFHFNVTRRRHHLGMFGFYHLQHRCESWAVNGYLHGVEYRYPLLDRRIVEYMLTVPSASLCETDHNRPLLREIGADVLPDEVRYNFSKNDPVYRAFMNRLTEDAAAFFMDETEQWKMNPDLKFIDFSRLEADIARYRSGLQTSDCPVLLRTVVYIKALHEFTSGFNKGHDD